MNAMDKLIRRNTGFTSLDDMLNAGGNYRPSCCVSDPAMRRIANAYDAAQEKRGDPRRAYRWRHKELRSWKQRLSYAVNLSPVRVVFNTPEIEERAKLARIKIRAEIHEENNPRHRAAYTADQWTALITAGLSCPIR